MGGDVRWEVRYLRHELKCLHQIRKGDGGARGGGGVGGVHYIA